MATKQDNSVEFISYDGAYPNLCRGTLEIKVNGEIHWLEYCLQSGGDICRNEDWDMWAIQGPWEVDLSEYPKLQPYYEEIKECVNNNVPYGCCGGCI